MLPLLQDMPETTDRPLDIASLVADRQSERYALHTRYLNGAMVKVLKTLGYDVGFKRGQGAYLFDRNGERYLDLLSGWGVFALGRNHPAVREALVSTLDAEMANLVQMDVSLLAGLLAERLIARVPYLDKVFFANSGAESVEAAIKFARQATGREGILHCDHAFHGLTYGALSLTADKNFRNGFGALLPGCAEVPFNDLPALEKALSKRQFAAFIVEPIQGKGVNMPSPGYLTGVQALCRKYGTLFVADEIQTGIGRTGKFLACEHWGVEPDMVLLAKALSGGHVPVGAVLARAGILDKTFNRMDRAVVHGSTFGKNDLAMAAGLATLDTIEREGLIENAERMGNRLIASLGAMADRYEFLHDVRGKGLMVGVAFGPPRSLTLKAAWSMLEGMSAGMFCQMISIPLFKEHKILTQVAGHGSHVIKLLPPLTLTSADCDWIEGGFDDVIAESHRVPGSVWSLGKTLAGHAMRREAV